MTTDNIAHKLGFDTVSNFVSRHCASQPGIKALNRLLKFSNDYIFIKDRLEETAEMLQIIGQNDTLRLNALTDLTVQLHAIRPIGTFLPVDELASLRSSLDAIDSITSSLLSTSDETSSSTSTPLLSTLASQLQNFPEISSAIDRTLNRFGEVKDTASPELAEIRRSLASTQASVGSIMRRVMSRAVEGGWLEADTNPVIRSGRLVLPVSPMNKRRIPGIVHDESASGKTFYIEPAELVEANNRIRELQLEERHEITRILQRVTEIVRPHIDNIIESIDLAGQFDFIRAKAIYAKECGASMPHLANKCQLEWYHAINPVLEASLARHGKQAVALDITLTAKSRILIISGPNAGGKSVCLKTVGLLQYMLQSGLLPPVYENSHFGVFDNIFIDIGDDQSIEDDLSTYSSHLRNMNRMLRNSTASTLLLIDEFGSGTEPLIGGALAQAILKQLNQIGVWGVITTHYQNLKTYAEDTDGLINGSMLYDRQLMQPLFKLSIGNAGSSFAIEIARKTGLPAAIIDDAEAIAGSDYVNMDRFLLDIARDRRYWENKRQQIRIKEKKVDEVLDRYENEAEVLRSQRREIIAQAKKEASEIISQSNAAVERTIREIRETQADRERTRQARERLKEQRTILSDETNSTENHPLLRKTHRRNKKQSTVNPAPKSAPVKEITEGSNVKMEGQSTVGTVASISGKKAVVNFNGVKMTIPLDKLTPTMAKPASGSSGVSFLSSQTTDASRSRQLNFRQEIDLRGMRLDEALQQVEYYIDDAIQFNAQRVRILHGTGTGALRQGIRQYLSTIDGVESYHDEHPQFGGAGVTVVDLK